MSTKVGSLAGSLADALSNQTDSQRVRGEIAGLMGIAPDRAGFAQRLRLDRATLLAIEIERQQAAQCQGHAVDVVADRGERGVGAPDPGDRLEGTGPIAVE
jgi:hypothetical protein